LYGKTNPTLVVGNAAASYTSECEPFVSASSCSGLSMMDRGGPTDLARRWVLYPEAHRMRLWNNAKGDAYLFSANAPLTGPGTVATAAGGLAGTGTNFPAAMVGSRITVPVGESHIITAVASPTSISTDGGGVWINGPFSGQSYTIEFEASNVALGQLA